MVYEQKHAIQNDFSIGTYYVTEEKFQEMQKFELKPGDLIVSCSGTMGKIAIAPEGIKPGIINQALLRLTPLKDKTSANYIKYALESDSIQKRYFQDTSGAAIKNVASVKVLKRIEIPLPSLEIQQSVISKIEHEQTLIESNRELIDIFQAKIDAAISRVCGE